MNKEEKTSPFQKEKDDYLIRATAAPSEKALAQRAR